QQLRLARVCAVKHLAATSESSLGEVLRSFQPPSYHLIWVVDLDGKVAGFLGELEVISALFEHGLSCKLGTLTMQQLSRFMPRREWFYGQAPSAAFAAGVQTSPLYQQRSKIGRAHV